MAPKTPAIAHTVLMVDDEPAIRQIARRILEDGGYHITEAEGGLEAIALRIRSTAREVKNVDSTAGVKNDYAEARHELGALEPELLLALVVAARKGIDTAEG